MINFLNKIISWSFYALFLLIPLIFTSNTSELFEFNKMWLTFGLTVIIVGSWIIKMSLEGSIRIQRTPLDIPILLFLFSQFLSTIFSLDTHTSFWGYYSRFNGGFLSLLTYVLLYYAFVSNISKKQVLSYLLASIVSAVTVSLWGLPAHFGYDPTCFLFRGTFDVSCWTSAFQPKVRIFSTLGQPDWLSAYLGVLVPLAIGVAMYLWEKQKKIFSLCVLLATFLFYVDFLFARSRGGFIGLAVGMLLFAAWYVWHTRLWTNLRVLKTTYIFPLAILGILVITFFIGTAISQVDKFMLPGIMTAVQQHAKPQKVVQPAPQPAPMAGELGGTDSGKIRLFVWQGALETWLHYPVFGTGVETFAYAYYLFMPPGHNLTSEFGYLYNKAHNEYLNYLATTGTVGFVTYMLMIGFFLWFAIKKLILDTGKLKLDKETGNLKLEKSSLKTQSSPNQSPSSSIQPLIIGLIAAYISLLVSNFFGFSVVITNIFLFLIPAFVFLLQGQLNPKKALLLPKVQNPTSKIDSASPLQWIVSVIVVLVGLYFLYTLVVFWQADTHYALGQNYVNAQDYQNAYAPLHQAVQMRPGEPVFQDELSLDDAVLAAALFTQDKTATSTAQQLLNESLVVSNNLTASNPNIVTYWKTRVRVMYALSQIDPKYMNDALTAVEKAAILAPTDAKVSYNLGLIQGQTGHIEEAIQTLNKTIQLKKDYRDAYYALGLFYHAAGVSNSGVITSPEDAQKAIDEMHFILKNFNPKDQQALAALKAWGAE